MLNEAHAAHVRGEIIDFVHALGRKIAIFFEIEIKLQIFDIIESLIPFVHGFHVHSADLLIPLLPKFGDKVATNKPACAGHQNTILTFQIRPLFDCRHQAQYSFFQSSPSMQQAVCVQVSARAKIYLSVRN